MAEKNMNAVLRLRKDTEYSFNTKPSFIPMDGEVCIVSTALEGLRVKIGDGVTQYRQLPYTDFGIILKGYYYEGRFYSDAQYQNELPTNAVLYIDIPSRSVYYYQNNAYVKIGADVPYASAEVAGIAKLYGTWDGLAEDGSVTQASLKAQFDDINSRLDALERQKLLLENQTLEFKDFNFEIVP